MDIQVNISAAACFIAALCCLVIPLDWLAAALTAAAIHELFHILGVIIAGGRIFSIRIGAEGAVICASAMTAPREMFCILAGPAGSLALLLLRSWFPGLALWGLVQGLFNLLPVYPLDGGRLLHCVAGYLFSEKTAEHICSSINWVILILIFAAGIWLTVAKKLGPSPLVAAAFFVSRVMDGKIPCKEKNQGVQYSYHLK